MLCCVVLCCAHCSTQLYFTSDHEWLSVTDSIATVGITGACFTLFLNALRSIIDGSVAMVRDFERADHAQGELGDIVYVGLPDVDDEFERECVNPAVMCPVLVRRCSLTAVCSGVFLALSDPSASVESVKAASDVYAPVTGKVVAVNDVRVLVSPLLAFWRCFFFLFYFFSRARSHVLFTPSPPPHRPAGARNRRWQTTRRW